MPTFKGQVTEEQLIGLVAYIKSLSGVTGSAQNGNPPASNTAANSSTHPPANTAANTSKPAARANRNR
jgi:hypothetical protein